MYRGSVLIETDVLNTPLWGIRDFTQACAGSEAMSNGCTLGVSLCSLG